MKHINEREINQEILFVEEALLDAYENSHSNDAVDVAIKAVRDLEWKYRTDCLRGYTRRTLMYLEKARKYKLQSKREEWLKRAYDYLPDRLKMPIRLALNDALDVDENSHKGGSGY